MADDPTVETAHAKALRLAKASFTAGFDQQGKIIVSGLPTKQMRTSTGQDACQITVNLKSDGFDLA